MLLFVGRFICGFATGLHNSAVPLYMKEITPLSMTG
jgi:hypothetical protein